MGHLLHAETSVLESRHTNDSSSRTTCKKLSELETIRISFAGGGISNVYFMRSTCLAPTHFLKLVRPYSPLSINLKNAGALPAVAMNCGTFSFMGLSHQICYDRRLKFFTRAWRFVILTIMSCRRGARNDGKIISINVLRVRHDSKLGRMDSRSGVLASRYLVFVNWGREHYDAFGNEVTLFDYDDFVRRLGAAGCTVIVTSAQQVAHYNFSCTEVWMFCHRMGNEQAAELEELCDASKFWVWAKS